MSGAAAPVILSPGGRPAAATRTLLLLGGGAAAVGLRQAVGAPLPPASLGAAGAFAAALLLLAAAAGWRWRRDPHWARALVLGAVAGVVLVLSWMTAAPHLPSAGQHLGALLPWTPVVIAVAVSEEVAIRGALFAAMREWGGAGAALAVTSLAFALMHVPLYGWTALPLDAAAGLLLGGLRLLSGGVTAPATAHALADLAAGWLG